MAQLRNEIYNEEGLVSVEFIEVDEPTTGIPYKVFTALLTQNGVEDKHEYIVNYGDVVTHWPNIPAGTTMVILQNDSESDFIKSGAPDNDAGTWFIYNGNEPNIIAPTEGEGVIDIGYDLGAPVATVLENTIGNIWFTYVGPGSYDINSNGLFIIHKTWGIADAAFDSPIAINRPVLLDFSDQFGTNLPNIIDITIQGSDYNGDNLLNNTPIEIRVYNPDSMLQNKKTSNEELKTV